MGTEPNVKQGATASTPIFLAGQIAGVLVQEDLGFRFVAVDHRFSVLDGSRFRNAESARQSAVRLVQATAEQVNPDREDRRVCGGGVWFLGCTGLCGLGDGGGA
jgi:hypothetical protein